MGFGHLVHELPAGASLFAVALLSPLALVLPLMLGGRTPLANALLVAGLATVAIGVLWTPEPIGASGRERRAWGWYALLFSACALLQVAPLEPLARVLGPYPALLWQQPDFQPLTWSPNPAATLTGWAVFLALWTAAFSVRFARRHHLGWILLAIVAASAFQALYGMVALAAQSPTILGLWPRNNPGYLTGTFTNRNLAAGFLSLTWPLAVGIWWIPNIPGISRLPYPWRMTGTLLSGGLIGMGLLSTGSRLGVTAGIAGMIVGLVLWVQQRTRLHPVFLWSLYAAVVAGVLGALWYDLSPLILRFADEGLASQRWEVWTTALSGLPGRYWLTGVGLGGFEAVFKSVQGADITPWYDYLHNDLLQLVLEMGVPGVLMLAAAVVVLWHRRHNNLLRGPLYAGLTAISIVALGDFSWHVGATQLVIACYIGVLLRPSRTRARRRHRRDSTGSESGSGLSVGAPLSLILSTGPT